LFNESSIDPVDAVIPGKKEVFAIRGQIENRITLLCIDYVPYIYRIAPAGDILAKVNVKIIIILIIFAKGSNILF
jgi:hypothetical protein